MQCCALLEFYIYILYLIWLFGIISLTSDSGMEVILYCKRVIFAQVFVCVCESRSNCKFNHSSLQIHSIEDKPILNLKTWLKIVECKNISLWKIKLYYITICMGIQNINTIVKWYIKKERGRKKQNIYMEALQNDWSIKPVKIQLLPVNSTRLRHSCRYSGDKMCVYGLGLWLFGDFPVINRWH